jgi:hypothetical protein
MNAMTPDALETRRQVLMATAALQRFEMRAHVGTLRMSTRPAAWARPALLATGAAAGSWLLLRRGPLAGAMQVLRLAAVIAFWGSSSAAQPLVQPAAVQKAAQRQRCDTCGVVQSIRRVEAAGNDPAHFEFVVRLRDGSTRLNRAPGVFGWHLGDRVKLVGGAEAR